MLKDSWDNVKLISIQKCFINCGCPDQPVHVPVEDDENEEDEFDEFIANYGMTKEEYSAMDDTIATNMTIEQNWEENLSSLCSSEEVLESTDEDENSSRSTSVITPELLCIT